jgi:hypothetical protein
VLAQAVQYQLVDGALAEPVEHCKGATKQHTQATLCNFSRN